MPSEKTKRGGKRPGAGHPREFAPTDRDKQLVTLHASIGIPQADIVLHIINPKTGRPIDQETLTRHFGHELAIAKTQGIAFAANCLTRQMAAGNVAAAIFWLKVQARWKEPAQALEHMGVDGAPPIRVESLTDEQLEILIARLKKARGGG